MSIRYAKSSPYGAGSFEKTVPVVCMQEEEGQPRLMPQYLSSKPYNLTSYNQYGDMNSPYLVPAHSPVLPQGQTVKLSCKGDMDMAVGVRDGRVVMVPYDPSDPTQQWIKDESWGRSVRDTVGHPAFALVNKATGKALRHAPGVYQEVLLTKYEAGSYDPAIMWSQSEDFGGGFKTIRLANNIALNLDCFQGDVKHGGIKDGNMMVLWTWNHQDNQLWKINPVHFT